MVLEEERKEEMRANIVCGTFQKRLFKKTKSVQFFPREKKSSQVWMENYRGQNKEEEEMIKG